MPSAATAAKWQLVIDPAKLWLVVEIKNGEAKKASCKLCTKWQNKVRRSRNYNDALICGIEGNALKKDNIVKHEMSDQHRDAVRFEKGPFSVADVYKHTTIGTGRDGGRLYADVVRERRVSTANRFELLQGEKEREEVIYMGDSIVRKIDRTVCRGRKMKTTTVCLPGARVDDVRKRVGQVMGPGTGGAICVHVGTNDADREGTTAIVGKFRALVRELKARRVGKIWISGILPVMGGRKGYRNCRRMSINSQLDGMCRQEKVGFVDLWATFAGRPDLYRKDGLHMTDRGAEVLGAGLARAMGSGGAPFLN